MTNPEDIMIANRFIELPKETQKFLSRLQDDDIRLLEEGLRARGVHPDPGQVHAMDCHLRPGDHRRRRDAV